MRHVYVCPMRWADLDLLGHVNNVTYVDYLQEARIDLLRRHAAARGATDDLAEGVVVVRHEIDFVAPLALAESVRIECWVSEVRAASFTVAYEVLADVAGRRTVALRASTVLTPFLFAEERPRRITAVERESLRAQLGEPLHAMGRLPATPDGPGHDYALHVRWSDVDAYGHVNNVTYVEYFQEARIRYVDSLRPEGDERWSRWVVAATSIEYKRPILFRAEPYRVRTWVVRLGVKSVEMLSEIRDGGRVLARARVVLVGFDAETQRAAEISGPQRERLLAELTPGS